LDSDDGWDLIWRRERQTTHYESKWYALLQNIVEELHRIIWALEAGCGSGRGIKRLTYVCYNVVGIDLSAEAIRLSKKNLKGLKNTMLVLADILHLPFKDGAFSLVYNSGVIEHLRGSNDLSALVEFRRVISDDGLVVISVPNRLCVWYVVWKSLLRLIGRWSYGYERSYTPWEIQKKLLMARFVVTKTYGLLLLPPISFLKKIEFDSRFSYALVLQARPV
jgi:SAM-dependent methyltransferase